MVIRVLYHHDLLLREANEYLATFHDKYPGLRNWHIKWSNTKRIFGDTNYWDQVIRVSLPATLSNEDSVFWDTVKHEIAHAIAGPLVKSHGDEWQAIAIRLGANPKPYTVGSEPVPGRIVGTCPAGHKYYRHRMTKKLQTAKYSCNKCFPNSYNPNYPITWRMNQSV